ncbi:MAG: DUF1800 domain-containing protein [Chthonomonadales bacterium]|nr:DUF1800 domain-containing protein [Chthonomonadales bacterium]
MRASRREWLAASAAAGAAGMLSGCARVVDRALPLPPAEPPPGIAVGRLGRLTRLLARAGFGPGPGDLALAAELGAERWVEMQLAASARPSAAQAARLRPARALDVPGMEVRELPENAAIALLQRATLLQAVYSPNQLLERLVDFWTNHFNIYARKRLGAALKPRDDLDVVRPHALGTFPAMLRASAHSPAMLGYLDNDVNRRGRPNENYGRELLELHTLGVDAGYTQRDVLEVARCFTGWTVERRFLRARGRFRFEAELHDDGEKTVLGHRIAPGGGRRDGERVLGILAAHPATARHVGGKLARCFLGEAGEAWTGRVAAIYERTGGDIREMVSLLLQAPELLSGPPILKRPFDLVVSALRVTGADTDGGPALHEHLARMGQPLHEWPMPDGYPDASAPWSGSMLARWNFALALAGGGIPGTSVPAAARETDDALARAILAGHGEGGVPAADVLLRHVARAGGAMRPSRADLAGLALASPAFQWR